MSGQQKIPLRYINVKKSHYMAFKCECCGEYSHHMLMLDTYERICHTCEAAMKQLSGKTTITERQARWLHVTQQQVEFFGVEYRLTSCPQPQTTQERSRLDQKAEQDSRDLFGE